MKYLLLSTLLSAATPYGAPPDASFVSARPSLTEAEEASARDHIAEMARLNGTSSELSQAAFIDYVIIPIGCIFAIIVLLRQAFSAD